MKRLSSKEIAISGVATSIAIIAVIIQSYLPTMRIAVNVIGAAAVFLPLCVGSIKGAVFTYLISSSVGLAVSTIQALPFVLFFGLYSIIMYALDYIFYAKVKLKNWIKIIIIILIKWAYYAIAFFAIYKLMGLVIADIALFGWKWTWHIIALLVFILVSIYDPLLRYVFEAEMVLYSKISKSKGKKNDISKEKIDEDKTVDRKENKNKDIFE